MPRYLSRSSSSSSSSSILSRIQIAQTARNVLTESWSPAVSNAGAVLVSQKVYATLLGFESGLVITNILVHVQTAGVGAAPVRFELGLLDKTGARVASTGDVKANAAFLTTGIAALPLAPAYTVTSQDGYYVAILQDGAFAGTPIQLARAPAVLGASKAAVGGVRLLAVQTGQTSIPNPATLVDAVAGEGYWVGVN